VLAERIIEYRETNGSFQSLDELSEVSGIGSALLEQLRDQVTL
jgi:competence protein ComEA